MEQTLEKRDIIESIYATKEKRWYERLKEAGEETE